MNIMSMENVISSKTNNIIGGMIPAGSEIVPSTKSRRIMQISEVPLSKKIQIISSIKKEQRYL